LIGFANDLKIYKCYSRAKRKFELESS